MLSQALPRIEELTDFESFRLKLKFATDDELNAGTRKFFKTQMNAVIAMLDSELTSVLGPAWQGMKAQSGSLVATHSILVLWKASRDPLFVDLSPEHQNVMMWTCLLHDIAKRGSPVIKGRDFVHAFRSAAAALKTFE